MHRFYPLATRQFRLRFKLSRAVRPSMMSISCSSDMDANASFTFTWDVCALFQEYRSGSLGKDVLVLAIPYNQHPLASALTYHEFKRCIRGVDRDK